MKRNVFILCLRCAAVCSLLALSGCGPDTIYIADSGSPAPEKACTLNILTTLTVKHFDGKDVQWNPEKKGSAWWVSVRIPAGNHTFLLNYDYREVYLLVGGGGSLQGSGGAFTSDNFIVGHTYDLIAYQPTPTPTPMPGLGLSAVKIIDVRSCLQNYGYRLSKR